MNFTVRRKLTWIVSMHIKIGMAIPITNAIRFPL